VAALEVVRIAAVSDAGTGAGAGTGIGGGAAATAALPAPIGIAVAWENVGVARVQWVDRRIDLVSQVAAAAAAAGAAEGGLSGEAGAGAPTVVHSYTVIATAAAGSNARANTVTKMVPLSTLLLASEHSFAAGSRCTSASGGGRSGAAATASSSASGFGFGYGGSSVSAEAFTVSIGGLEERVPYSFTVVANTVTSTSGDGNDAADPVAMASEPSMSLSLVPFLTAELAAPAGVSASYDNATLAVDVAWEPVDGAAGYMVDVACDDRLCGDQPPSSTRVAADSTAATVPLLFVGGGAHDVTVRAFVDRVPRAFHGRARMWGRSAMVTVAAGRNAQQPNGR
jgi:hypothetical protein